MNKKMFSVALLFLWYLTGPPGYASPKFRVSSMVADIEKGHSFEILMVIDTDEPLSEITIAPLAPDGFLLTAKPIPGVTLMPDPVTGPNVKIEGLSPGDSLTISFPGDAPSQWQDLYKKKALYSTRDPKVFSFNITYKTKDKVGQEITRHQTESVSLRYTTSLFIYLLSGLIGVLLGFIVKTITQNTRDIARSMRDRKKFLGNAGELARYVVILRLPFLLTTLVIGFGVLLSMAQDKIPVNGWFQATALGIGLGILSDEKLITKLRGGGPSSEPTEPEKKKGTRHLDEPAVKPEKKHESHS